MTGWQRLSVAAMTVWTVLGVAYGLFALAMWFSSDDMPLLLVLAMVFAIWLTIPLLVFLLQWVTRWIYRGFRGD